MVCYSRVLFPSLFPFVTLAGLKKEIFIKLSKGLYYKGVCDISGFQELQKTKVTQGLFL